MAPQHLAIAGGIQMLLFAEGQRPHGWLMEVCIMFSTVSLMSRPSST